MWLFTEFALDFTFKDLLYSGFDVLCKSFHKGIFGAEIQCVSSSCFKKIFVPSCLGILMNEICFCFGFMRYVMELLQKVIV